MPGHVLGRVRGRLRGRTARITAGTLIVLGGALPTLAAAPAGAAPPVTSASPASAARSQVIVVLRHQYPHLVPTTPGRAAARVARVDRSQDDVVASLRRADAKRVRRLQLVNAVGATVTAAEATRLRADPSVAAVVPDAVLRAPTPLRATPKLGPAARSTSPDGICPSRGKVQLDPEGISAIRAASDNPRVITARTLGFSGAGVRIGNISTGIQPGERELVRADGRHVIEHYRDFTGEGTSVQGDVDAEGYLDTSVIGAQGREVYDLSKFGTGLPSGCNIRLRGAAPGATIDEYKVYGVNVQTTTSAFLEAIDEAVDVDHVNVLNEEAGSYPMPDTSQDLIKDANAAAMAAGVTITSPTYDAGPNSTIWSPSSQPGVISVGASTTFRVYAQDDIGDYREMHSRGWISGNVSALSSGGSTQNVRTVDVLAPGDLDWIACTPKAPACGGSALSISGGTSESGPLVAAVCALVIQAYRHSHHGANPTPALVRDIISSTADDASAPASEQGAGVVDAYRAVSAAVSVGIPHLHVSGPPSIVASTQQLSATGTPGSAFSQHFTLRNDGTSRITAQLGTRRFGALQTLTYRTLGFGKYGNDKSIHFTVRRAATRLTVDIGNPGGANDAPLSVSLTGPNGRFYAYSLPEGTGNHGHVEVHNAPAGSWTARISPQNGSPRYQGNAYVRVATASLYGFGTVTPSRVTLAPGARREVMLRADVPASPGDASAAVTIRARGAHTSTLPVTTRALVALPHGVGHFHAVLEGGNGRGFVPAQTFFYSFDIAGNPPDLDVQTSLEDGDKDPYYVYLVDPQGNAVAQSSNRVLVGGTQSAPATVAEPGAQVHALSPGAGQWTVIITFTNPVTGDRLRTPLDGTVSTAAVPVSSSGLPDSSDDDAWAPGSQHVIGVQVHNTGVAPQAYFLDARLPTETSLTLRSITPSTVTLPSSANATYPQWVVPTNTSSLTATATSTARTTFDMQPQSGEPDVAATVGGYTAQATVTGAPVPQGDWAVTPQRTGPFSAGAAHSTTSISFVAQTREFDDTVTSATGDLWNQGSGQPAFAPVVVQPGATTTVYGVITPVAADAGQTVSGTLFLDAASAVSNGGVSPSADQLAELPYEYSVAG